MIANYINHICLVLDESYSMLRHKDNLLKVYDGQIAYLAERSKELDQETRITVYTFNTPGYGLVRGWTTQSRKQDEYVRCHIYDKDVLRVPSMHGLYKPAGQTPLIDAALLAIEDLRMTPEKYGEHAFLIYVLTDGQNNDSRHSPTELSTAIAGLPAHWTLAAFVLDQMGVFNTKSFGFPAGNISVWDTTNAQGISEVGEQIRQTSERFMTGRTSGVRGYSSLFTVSDVKPADVKAKLVPLTKGSYWFAPVIVDTPIDQFAQAQTNKPYIPGKCYYQLTKTVTVQPQKNIAIEANGEVYMGDAARSMLGLPNYSLSVKPGFSPGVTIFVQSTSMNRKLLAGTRLLMMR